MTTRPHFLRPTGATTNPTQRRARQTRNGWLFNAALVLIVLAILAGAQFILLMNSLPVKLPEPPAAKAPPLSRHAF